ncbi:hypothetical protein PoMZ_13709, partial [Pyricularia oryzae]
RLAGRLADVFFVALVCVPRKQRTQFAVDNGDIILKQTMLVGCFGVIWRQTCDADTGAARWICSGWPQRHPV